MRLARRRLRLGRHGHARGAALRRRRRSASRSRRTRPSTRQQARVPDAGLRRRRDPRAGLPRRRRPFDAISSIGMFEHVGLARLGEYFTHLHELLGPSGRLLNHGISRPAGKHAARFSRRGFIDRYVFPDGELHEVGSVVSRMQQSGFEVRHVESLREHYALTLRQWVRNLEANWDDAVADGRRGTGPGVAPLHGRLRAQLRGRPQPDPPGARDRAPTTGAAACPGGPTGTDAAIGWGGDSSPPDRWVTTGRLAVRAGSPGSIPAGTPGSTGSSRTC